MFDVIWSEIAIDTRDYVVYSLYDMTWTGNNANLIVSIIKANTLYNSRLLFVQWVLQFVSMILFLDHNDITGWAGITTY